MKFFNFILVDFIFKVFFFTNIDVKVIIFTRKFKHARKYNCSVVNKGTEYLFLVNINSGIIIKAKLPYNL